MLSERGLVVGCMGAVVLGAGCPSPLPEVDTDGSEWTGGDQTMGDTATGNDGTDPGNSETGPICGNGIVEAGEECDDEGESANCDEDCTIAACGDLHVNGAAGEECEDDDLGTGTCEKLGFDVGTLACGTGCSYDESGCYVLPEEPVLQLSFSQVKRFDFSWEAVAGADYYRIEESVAPSEPFVQIGEDIMGESVSHEMPLHFRWQASYQLQACNGGGCTPSAAVEVMSSLVDAVGYVKASNTDSDDEFGYSGVCQIFRV